MAGEGADDARSQKDAPGHRSRGGEGREGRAVVMALVDPDASNSRLVREFGIADDVGCGQAARQADPEMVEPVFAYIDAFSSQNGVPRQLGVGDPLPASAAFVGLSIQRWRHGQTRCPWHPYFET